MPQSNATHIPRIAQADPVFELIRRLKDHAEAGAADTAVDRARLMSLRLGESVLRRARAARPKDRAFEIAVVGPTQTGKSTVVNLLLGKRLAQVSPLAGFTRHPHGFAIGGGDDPIDDSLFPGYTRGRLHDDVPADALHYSLQRVDGAAMGHRVILWDSPDFDSISSGVYQRGLLELMGRADAFVVVLSKEKYADLSVWTMLRLLAPLRRPTAIVLNKMTPDAIGPLRDSLQARLGEMAWPGPRPSIYTLDYDARRMMEDPASLNGDASVLREAVFDLASMPSPRDWGDAQAGDEFAFVRAHWSEWTAPLRAQHAALGQWRSAVSAAAEQFVAVYRRDYLDHPRRYDSFRRATLELLTLIELPKLGGAITKVRRAVTWPVRQLFATTRSAISPSSAAAEPGDVEAGVLIEAAESMLTLLARDAARKSDVLGGAQSVWRAISAKLSEDEGRLRMLFESALREHHETIRHEVHTAAGELYEGLQKSPVQLAALRTARTTLDVGMLVLALKTGGLTPLDAVYAPATFALSSMLVEEMAGLKMGHVARNLKTRQLSTVRQSLVDGILVRELSNLIDQLGDAAIARIEPELLAAADRELAKGEASPD